MKKEARNKVMAEMLGHIQSIDCKGGDILCAITTLLTEALEADGNSDPNKVAEIISAMRSHLPSGEAADVLSHTLYRFINEFRQKQIQ